jgi:hypothetical protein
MVITRRYLETIRTPHHSIFLLSEDYPDVNDPPELQLPGRSWRLGEKKPGDEAVHTPDGVCCSPVSGNGVDHSLSQRRRERRERMSNSSLVMGLLNSIPMPPDDVCTDEDTE